MAASIAQRATAKGVAHPKLPFLDTEGRAAANRLAKSIEGAERGHLLETYVLHELRA